jgi:hypothetical protein
MLNCPMCKKAVPENSRFCPRCSTDLSLLSDYVNHLHVGLERAEDLTRQGQLGEAVWAYLEVLEVDPENSTARKQVGAVATAVRQFDRAAPGRRWLDKLRRQARFRRWLDAWDAQRSLRATAVVVAGVALLVGTFILGYYCGSTRHVEDSSQQGVLDADGQT